MSDTLFFRALSVNDKATVLEHAIKSVSEGNVFNSTVYIANPSSFNQIPGSTFAYWVSEQVQNIFTKFPIMEGSGRAVRQGLVTAQDFRFLRLYWEVSPNRTILSTPDLPVEKISQQTFHGKRWIPFAKGGAYSPYYADLHLVVNWERDGDEIRNIKDSQTGKVLSRPQSIPFYFRPGLTWSLRTSSDISVRILPQGCIISHKGPAAFTVQQQLPFLLAIMNSKAFGTLVALQLGAADAAARSYEVGLIQRTPIPETPEEVSVELSSLALKCVNLKRKLDAASECSHVFYMPAILQHLKNKVKSSYLTWQSLVQGAEKQLLECQEIIDNTVYQLYDFSYTDRLALENMVIDKKTITGNNIISSEDEEENLNGVVNESSVVTNLLSYIFGSPFGRWDIRYATGELPAPELPDPFAPLPVCSPGMFIGEDGLPLRTTPDGYPLDIKWDGIMVDDPDHPDDIVRRVREVLAVIWQDRAEAIEQEVCQILEISDLRDYFRRPGKGGFWDDHIQRYSKSRRKAPIYWLLQSEKRNYGIWIYYHRLDKDLLFKALVNYVEPKLRMEEDTLAQLKTAQNPALVGHEAKQVEQKIERQERLLTELSDFRDKLSRAANLGLEPDLNDGVLLNIAPLRELVPWKEAKKYWDELEKGKYEWSSISQQLHTKGNV